MLNRMSQLEECLRQKSSHGPNPTLAGATSTSTSPSQALPTPTESASQRDDHPRPSITEPPSRRRRLQYSEDWPSPAQTSSTPTELEEEGHTQQDRTLASIDLQRYFGPVRQQSRVAIDVERQSLLETAISLAKQVALKEPRLDSSMSRTGNLYEQSMYPSTEFLYLMLHGRSSTIRIKYGHKEYTGLLFFS